MSYISHSNLKNLKGVAAVGSHEIVYNNSSKEFIKRWLKSNMVNPKNRVTNSCQLFKKKQYIMTPANYICYNYNHLYSMILYEL